MGVNLMKMSISDKIVLFLEVICHFILVGAVIFLTITIKDQRVVEGGILFFSSLGLIMCIIEAKSIRETKLFVMKSKTKDVNVVNVYKHKTIRG